MTIVVIITRTYITVVDILCQWQCFVYVRAEGLASEIKDFQGQLADYNTVRKNIR